MKRVRRSTPVGAIIAVGVLALGVATGCVRGQAQQPVGAATVGTVSISGTPTGIRSSGAGGAPTAAASSPSGGDSAAAILPDGRSPVYLTGLDVASGTVTFDLIQFFGGGAATMKEWLKRHPDEPDGPPAGYFIVNDNLKLRTLPIAAKVKVEVVNFDAPSGVGERQIKWSALANYLAHDTAYKPDPGDRKLSWAPFWLTVSHGQVTVIEQQYLP